MEKLNIESLWNETQAVAAQVPDELAEALWYYMALSLVDADEYLIDRHPEEFTCTYLAQCVEMVTQELNQGLLPGEQFSAQWKNAMSNLDPLFGEPYKTPSMLQVVVVFSEASEFLLRGRDYLKTHAPHLVEDDEFLADNLQFMLNAKNATH
jgi:hypothetical protein